MYKLLPILLFAVVFSITKEDVYDDSWAVIIGIDKYKYSDPLKYAVNDANAIHDLLISKFNFPKDNIRFLKDEEATLQSIKSALYYVVKNAGVNDRILIYYSGHGETVPTIDGSDLGYIIPYEGKQSEPYITGLSMDEILKTSKMAKTKHMLFLMDACYSGLMTEATKGLSKATDVGYLSTISTEQSRQIITAGSSDQKVIERDAWQHSAFTKNLLSGLGEWSADGDGNGYITADELGTYLRISVTNDTENMQTPSKARFQGSGTGEFIFFQLINSTYKEIYYDSGGLWKQGAVNNGFPHGNWTYYYKSGYKLLEGQFQNGRAHGMWTWYDDNGQKAIEANLVDGSIDAVELKLYDFIVQHQEKRLNSDIVIIERDEKSLEFIPDLLPYSRSLWGKVVKNLADANAKVIVFDFIFEMSDPQTQIVEKYIKKYNLQGAITDADKKFIESIEYAELKGTKVIIASKIAYDSNLDNPTYFLGAHKKFTNNEKINTLMGLVNIPTDEDGINRSYWPISKVRGDSIFYNSLAIQTVIEYLGIASNRPVIDRNNKVVSFGSFNKPNYLAVPSGNIYEGFRIDFSTEIVHIPLYKILDTIDYELIEMDNNWMENYTIQNNSVKNIFDEKIVMIGTSLYQDQDFVVTPYHSFDNRKLWDTPGVELHAHAIQTILDNSYNNIFPNDTIQYSSEFRNIQLEGDWRIY